MRHRPSCMIVGLAIVGVLAPALASTVTRASESGAPDNPAARHQGIGIWKADTPRDVKGELDNYDPTALATGALIKADCSITGGPGEGRPGAWRALSSHKFGFPLQAEHLWTSLS